jgi:DNA-binding NtrC family response regulator
MGELRILAIDDEQIVLDSLTRTLESEHYSVDATRSSREGLEWALSREYDLVLTDIRMPDIGGMRILRDIKRARPAVPVIMVTGYATVQSAVGAMKLGAADYIEKPFTPDELIEAIRVVLKASLSREPDEQKLIHREEIVAVLERAATDPSFVADLFYRGADALEPFDLTPAEKLAILTADVHWIEANIGKLDERRRKWLDNRLAAEVW